jgi:hypothetical protein
VDAICSSGEHGWRIVMPVTFERALAAAYRLVGPGDLSEALFSSQGCGQLTATARQILGRYQVSGDGR